jgi:tetratricopeptide (TPR) repeat protein
MRFFITDLYFQLNDQFLNENSSDIHVYRGQAISINELNLIRENIGEFLSMNSFLSTSKNREISMNFAKQIIPTSELTRILFEFNINRHIENIRPYANIKHLSYFSEEDELLIGLGAIFQINQIEYNQIEQIWICKMLLCSQDNYQLKDIMERDKKNIGQDITSLGYLLYQMGDKDKAKQYFKQLLNNQQSLTDLDISSCYRGLGAIAFAQDEFENALENHFKELEIYQNSSPPVPQFYIGDCYICIGNIYRYTNQLDKALQYQEKALNLLPEDHPSYPNIYRNIADIYSDQKKYDLAVENFNKCLSIQQTLLPDGHPHIGTTYANIGAMYGNKLDSKQALIYYEKAKNIWLKTRPPTHPDILQLEENMQICKDRIQWEEQQQQQQNNQ